MGVYSTADTLSCKFAAAARSARVGRRGRKQGPARSAGGQPTQGVHLDPPGRLQPGGSSFGPLKGTCRAPGPAAKPWFMPRVPAAGGSWSVGPPDPQSVLLTAASVHEQNTLLFRKISKVNKNKVRPLF